MDVDLVYRWGVASILLVAAVTFPALLFVAAPYGRHARSGWGPSLPARLGWMGMELPSPLCFVLAFGRGEHAFEALPLLFLGLYQLHYLQRTFIFPLLMRAGGRPMPLATAAMSFAFNIANGTLNGLAVSHFGSYGNAWLGDPRFLVGLVLFVAGYTINLHSDAVLRGLRGPGESGYKIPRRGLFRWVSSPNYFGEVVEWCGWALATWSAAGLAFAASTCANLAPRAISNHRWYRERFPDYPPERKAFLPGVW